MSGECDECNEHALDCECKFVEVKLKKAINKLKSILDDDVFHKSAFDPIWCHENDEIDQKLDELRVKISCLEDNLWDLWIILND